MEDPPIDIGTNISKRTILTGAGFAVNFDGYDTRTFNDAVLLYQPLQQCRDLYQLVRSKANFEDALGEARLTRSQEEVKVLEDAIRYVYGVHNGRVTNIDNPKYKQFESTYVLQGFLRRMALTGAPNIDAAYQFTLNQDLLFEAMITNQPEHKPYCLPGIPRQSWHFSTETPNIAGRIQINQSEDAIGRINLRGNINVIKLHGSVDWQTAAGDLLVIGSDKPEFISNNPLLHYYQRVFQQVCATDGMRLLVIGYGFWDEHINRIIATGIRTGLRLWVWDIMPRMDWQDKMENKGVPFGKEIAAASHYCTDELWKVFYGNSSGYQPLGVFLDGFLEA